MGNRIGKAFTENSQTTFARYLSDAQGNAHYLENGLNAPQPTLNILYGVTPELAELNIDFETYTTICGFSVDFEDQYTALINWTNPSPSTSYFCLGTYTKAPETGNADYRYGFGGMEKDNEVKGQGNSYTTEFRQYDSRINRWLSKDPLSSNFPWQSPYISMSNNPILRIDPNGDSDGTYIDEETGKELGSDGVNDGLEHLISNENCNKFDKSPLAPESKKEALAPYVIDTKSNGDIIAMPEWSSSATFITGLSTTMIGTASGYAANFKPKYSTNPKANFTPKAGSSAPFKTIAKSANILGGVVGALDNTIKSVNSFGNGNYIEGTYNATLASSYAVGTGMMFFPPLAPVGATILLVTSLTDIIGSVAMPIMKGEREY